MTRGDVCRLLGRVAFGATAADIDEWTGKPYADLVDRLLLIPTAPAGADDAGRVFSATSTANPYVYIGGLGTDLDGARLWWMERMRTTEFPLLERMTLFWHGHFATAVKPVAPDTGQVVHQVQTLRTHALGNFRTIVELMTVDPAMLHWLNGHGSSVPQPNENYARELFELFTLGKRPQVYTEKDIREAARALTGWLVVGPYGVAFKPTAHDAGTKRVLGQTIADGGAQEFRRVVEVALAQPVAARFLAYKLVQEFAYAPAGRDQLKRPDPLVKKVADTLTSSGWDVAKAMRTLLLADEFRLGSPLKRQQRVRQPVELVVHATKALNAPADNRNLLEPLSRMGQLVLSPPNVGGWPVGDGWLSPVATLGRYDLALTLRDGFGSITNPGSFLTGLELTDPPTPDDLDGWAKVFGIAGLSAATSAAIKGYLSKRKSDQEEVRRAGVVALILSSPEWVVM
jgi:uncharacterized protein (DUF1800 family)